MTRKKLEVVELNLGLDVDSLGKHVIHDDTRKRIDRTLNLAQKEKEALDKIRIKKQDKGKIVEKCYQEFVKHQVLDLSISADDLKKISGEQNLSGLMLRLRNHIKKSDNLWKLHKYQRKGKTLYKLIPS